jgi:hypothetical protein
MLFIPISEEAEAELEEDIEAEVEEEGAPVTSCRQTRIVPSTEPAKAMEQ